MPTPVPGDNNYDSSTQGVPVNLVNGSLSVAIGEVALGAADPGLVALLAGLVGPVASAKNFTDLYILATSGSGFKITGTVGVTNIATDPCGTTTPKTILDLWNVLTAASPATGITIATMPNVTLSSQAFTNTILTAIEDTIAHTIGVQVKGVRPAAAGCFAHRATLTAPDLVGAVATAPTAPTVADSTVAEGSLAHAPTTWYGGYVVRNGMGVTLASAIGNVSLSAAHSIRITIPAAWGSGLSDTDLVYEFFLSTDTAPKHVCTWTGAQLAAGAGAGTGCYCTTAETPLTNGTGRAAWAADIGVTGANAQTTAAQFATSTALSQASIAAIAPVSTAGYNNADVFIDAIQTAYTTVAPSLTLIPVYLNDKQATNYHVGAPIYVNLLNGVGQSFRQVYNLTTNGASVMILIASIANVTVNRIDITPTSVV